LKPVPEEQVYHVWANYNDGALWQEAVLYQLKILGVAHLKDPYVETRLFCRTITSCIENMFNQTFEGVIIEGETPQNGYQMV